MYYINVHAQEKLVSYVSSNSRKVTILLLNRPTFLKKIELNFSDFFQILSKHCIESLLSHPQFDLLGIMIMVINFVITIIVVEVHLWR